MAKKVSEVRTELSPVVKKVIRKIHIMHMNDLLNELLEDNKQTNKMVARSMKKLNTKFKGMNKYIEKW